MSESRRDVALLDALSIALDPAPAQPSASELFALRTAVAAQFMFGREASARPPVVRNGWSHGLLALARAVGVPVDSPDVVDVQRATKALQRDLLKPGRAAPGTTAAKAQFLHRKLSQLSPSERSRVGPEPHHTLERARRFLSWRSGGGYL